MKQITRFIPQRKTAKWGGLFGSGLFAGVTQDDDDDDALGPRQKHIKDLKAEASKLGVTPTQLHGQSAAAIQVLIKENEDLPLLKKQYTMFGGTDEKVINSSNKILVKIKMEEASQGIFTKIITRKNNKAVK